MSKITGIKKGDIVRVKFVDLKEIVTKKSKNGSYTLINEWELGSNIMAFVYGGDFLVKQDAPDASKNQVLELVNHLDSGTFDIPEEIISSIEVIEASNKFISEDHNLVITQVENNIFINGEELRNTDSTKHLDNFISFVERYLMNRAIENSINKD